KIVQDTSGVRAHVAIDESTERAIDEEIVALEIYGGRTQLLVLGERRSAKGVLIHKAEARAPLEADSWREPLAAFARALFPEPRKKTAPEIITNETPPRIDASEHTIVPW